jgi:hypothetical protein
MYNCRVANSYNRKFEQVDDPGIVLVHVNGPERNSTDNANEEDVDEKRNHCKAC